MPFRSASAGAAAAMTLCLVLPGCSSGDSQVCETLSEGGAGATIFNPYISWGSGPAEADSRLAVMDSVEEPPADLTEEWEVWRAHLQAISEAESAGDVPSDLVADAASGEAADAGSALADFYVDTCL